MGRTIEKQKKIKGKPKFVQGMEADVKESLKLSDRVYAVSPFCEFSLKLCKQTIPFDV